SRSQCVMCAYIACILSALRFSSERLHPLLLKECFTLKFLSFALVLVIALAGLLSPQTPPPLFPYIGFVLHCCGFILIALTARMAFPQVRTLWLWSILLPSSFLAEFIQLLQPLRDRKSVV